MRSGAIALVVMVLAGLGALVAQGASSKRSEAQSLFIPPIHPVADVPPRGEACQAPVWLEESFSQIVFTPDRPNEPRYWPRHRSPLDVRVSDFRTGRELSRGRLASDRTPGGPRVVPLDRRVQGERPLRVCLRNQGPDRVILWGATLLHEGTTNPYVAGVRRTDSDATVNAERIPGDLYLDFLHPGAGATSLLSQLPKSMERAARFKSPWMGGWTFWLLLGVFLTAAPFLLIRGLRALGQPDEASAERSPAST